MLKRFAVPTSLVMFVALPGPFGPESAEDGARLTLTILHNNDASSMLLNACNGLADFGGGARFKTLVDIERPKASAGPPT